MWGLTHYATFPSLVHGQQRTQRRTPGQLRQAAPRRRKVGENIAGKFVFTCCANIQHTLRLPAPPLLGRGTYSRAPPLIASCVHAFFCRSPFFLRACPLRSRPRGPACALFSSLLPRGRRHPSPTRPAAPRSSCCCLRAPAQLAQNGFPAPPPRRARRKRVGAVLFVDLPHLPQQPTVLLLRQLRPMHKF